MESEELVGSQGPDFDFSILDSFGLTGAFFCRFCFFGRLNRAPWPAQGPFLCLFKKANHPVFAIIPFLPNDPAAAHPINGFSEEGASGLFDFVKRGIHQNVEFRAKGGEEVFIEGKDLFRCWAAVQDFSEDFS